jgi:hypothetical protein
MKMKVYGATFATLELALDLAANQRVMNRLILQIMTKDNEELTSALKTLNQEVSKELALLRARLLRHSSVELTDLLNGEVDI